ncbi:serine/threonine-protein kinase [Mariniblastus fucicola]|uniref:Serine/threonine-protein kinase PknL n=1 Tax=Mariniblastus fucicola TaxID=980251 RepID=A0A5B9PG87_9BACT|nr:serine/threonine-protein kinase [Mariniblastus fucicola]QEG21773.1 Serine/threonine-protein kinase PknL [Mariniblastus fucicola]
MSPLQFVGELDTVPTPAFQLEVIAVDIELELTRGVKPPLQKYLSDFPYLGDEIPDVYADVVEAFIRNFCPVRSSLGGLKSTPEYDIGEEIDRGGMGVVYSAVQKSINRRVALKVLFLAREDIFTEARKAAVLNHRNICRIYDAGKIGEFPFMAMQFVQGQTLKRTLSQNRLSVEDAICVIVQVADALATAHRSNLVHFDVKPENIVTGVTGHAWLMDFGVAKKRSEIFSDATRLQPVSPVYCAPEQLSLQYGERGFRSDIYSLGLVLYELVTGRRAYDGDLSQIIDQLKHDPPRRPTDYDSRIPAELEAICLKAIQKQPGDRFGSMLEFRNSLTAFALKSNIDIHRAIVSTTT